MVACPGSLPRSGEAILEKDDPRLVVDRDLGLRPIGIDRGPAQMILPQPIGEGLRASGMTVAAFWLGIGFLIDLDGQLGIEGNAHAYRALVLPGAVTRGALGWIVAPQVDEGRLGHVTPP